MKVFSSSLFILTLAISPVFAASVSITTKSLPNGTLQTPYSASVNTSNGCTPFRWAIVSGKLPPGISMKVSKSTTSLSLTGTPSSTASSSFTVSVTACGGHNSKQAYTVKIQKGANHVVGLSWNPSTSKNIGGYNVYRSPDSKSWSKINPSVIASTIYDDSSVSNGSTYYYSATAVDISGKESAKTPSVKVTVP
jgi:putative Ig domain-containing protein